MCLAKPGFGHQDDLSRLHPMDLKKASALSTSRLGRARKRSANTKEELLLVADKEPLLFWDDDAVVLEQMVNKEAGIPSCK
mmetsp:Transcript_43193/g.104451  ORF Transcript_43193/g.104451 Transcript_43193/m.104451 type:complete len:81 (-) Transcript_43193:377-619(-)